MAARRHGLTFEDCRNAVLAILKAGLKVCMFVGIEWIRSTDAAKQCAMRLQERSASIVRDLSDYELTLGARELVRLAVERIGYYAEAALTLIGQAEGMKGRPLPERRKKAVEVLGTASVDYFRATHQPRIIDQTAESLYELLTRPHQLAAAIATQ